MKNSIIFAGLGSLWNGQRKLIHQFFGPPTMPLYHPMLESDSHDLVRRLVIEKKDFMTEVT